MKKNNKAFTLIEIIAVIIIIGIIALITITAVNNYINDASNTTYLSYENAMKSAAESNVADCMGGNINECNLPDQKEKKIKKLNSLIEEGYIDELKDPEGDGYCDPNLSYVEIYNEDASNYTYTACLYCGEYSTENVNCTTYMNNKDGNAPICGEQTPNTTKWTNTNRTITVGCTDEISGCVKSSFSKTFNKTTKTGNIVISDNSGETNSCSVNVFVDKTAPTCELEVISGTKEESGWYSGEVKVQLKNQKDGEPGEESGLLTYGIGTSIKERNYNKETTMTLKEGMTSVIGYVKDAAGNEGLCSIDVRVGTGKPQFDFRYGYQIYPNKEKYTVSNMTESGTTFKSTSTDPQISFTGLGKYIDVDKVTIYFKDPILQTTQGQVFYSNETHTEAQSSKVQILSGSKKAEFNIPKGTYQNIRIDLGNLNNQTYNIKRIELNTAKGDIYTNKDVTVNITPIDRGARTLQYSYDGGVTFTTESSKTLTANTQNQLVTKNDGGLKSNPISYSITGIDKSSPACSISSNNTNWTSSSIILTVNSSDIGVSGVKGTDWAGNTKTVNTNGTYSAIVTDNAGNSNTCQITISNIDTEKPVCTITSTNNLKSTSQTATIKCTDNTGIVEYTFGGNKETVTSTKILNKTHTITASGKYEVFVKDLAGNVSEVKSNTFYKYAINNYLLNVKGLKGTYDTSNYSLISNATYIAQSGTTLTLASVYTTPTGGTFKGYTAGGAISTTAPTLSANSTYSMWFDRNEYTFTVKSSVGGSTKAVSTQNTTGVTAASNGSNTLTVRYGDTVTLSASSSAGYRFDKYTGDSTAATISNITGNKTVTGNYEVCAAGTYSAGNSATCSTCSSGYYTNTGNNTGASTCTICPAGSSCNGKTATACAAGTYTNTAGKSNCTTCSSGYYTNKGNNTGATTCTICPKGSACNGKTATTCASGTYTNTTGKSSCTTCETGYYCTGGSAKVACSTLGTGYTSVAGAKANTSCYINLAAGQYKTATGTATACAAGTYYGSTRTAYYNTAYGCTTCSGGYYTNKGDSTGATTCTICPAGSSCNGKTATVCAIGTYSGAGASSCSSCPTGQVTDTTGATSSASCHATCTYKWKAISTIFDTSCSGTINNSSKGCQEAFAASEGSVGETRTICSSKTFCKYNGNYCYGSNTSCGCYPTKDRYRKITCQKVCE